MYNIGKAPKKQKKQKNKKTKKTKKQKRGRMGLTHHPVAHSPIHSLTCLLSALPTSTFPVSKWLNQKVHREPSII